MTIPEKPNSRLQQYQMTDQGREWLSGREENVGENVGETMTEKQSNVIQMPVFTADAKMRWRSGTSC